MIVLRWMQKIVAALGWIVSVSIFLPLCCLVACLPASKRYDSRLYFFLVYWWNWCMVRSAGLQLTVLGAENIPVYPNNPSIIVLNHASMYDIYVAEVLMQGYPHLWLSKESYLKVPLFGFLLARMGVAVDRFNPFKAAKSLLKACALAQDKVRHVVLFPEGTRFDDGQIHQFYSGLAVLAKKLNRPIVPICIVGMHQFMPRGSLWINPDKNKLTVIVGKPMICEQNETTEAFLARIQDWFCKNIKPL